MLNKKAFTLSELLLALAIVGILAALSIPNVIENMNRKIMGEQLKNTSLAIQNIVNEQLVKNNVKNISQTDFSDPEKLLSSDNFAIVNNSKACYITNTSKPYDCFSQDAKSIEKENPVDYNNVFDDRNRRAVKLKNGVTISYAIYPILPEAEDPPYGIFWVDLNGIAKPNILGRDLFVFRITEKGRLVNGYAVDTMPDADLKRICENGTSYSTSCYSLVERNNWKILY